MTAINTPIGQAGQTQAFRRGILAGLVASTLLAATLTGAAVASGLIELPQATIATDQAPAVVQTGPNVQLAPDAVHPQHRSDTVAPPPNVAPAPNAYPPMQYDQHNPLWKGNRGMW
jgi:hypothetical protein